MMSAWLQFLLCTGTKQQISYVREMNSLLIAFKQLILSSTAEGQQGTAHILENMIYMWRFIAL